MGKKVWVDMDDCLNPYSNGLPSRGTLDFVNECDKRVLIPILMDYPLGGLAKIASGYAQMSLNPYSNGLPSRGHNGNKGNSRT